jgi:hypothetical protein
MPSQSGRARTWLIVIAAIFAILLAGAGYIAYRARHADEMLRAWIIKTLSERFEGEVKLDSVHVQIFPLAEVTGHGLSIPQKTRTDLPPLIYINTFRFNVGLSGLLRPKSHIDRVLLDKMVITIPPREPKAKKPDSEKNPRQAILPAIIDELDCVDTQLVTLPKKQEPGKPPKVPLDWDIHNLSLRHIGGEKGYPFAGTLTNGKPKGEIATAGEFGPFMIDDPGASPVSGKYNFKDADLGPFPGIDGTLSSTGQYDGVLSELQVKGVTDTPDFSLDKVGKPVSLHTEYEATVDGTNGDTMLHPVRATLVKSVIISEGSVINVPGVGHNIILNVHAPNARIQDILALAMKSDPPILTGPAKITAKLVLPPGKVKVLEKMILDGTVGLDDAKWTSPTVREKLESLSRHAEGKPEDEDAGSAVSDLKGKFHMEKGVINFSSLTFSVPGATIDLAGTYDIKGGGLDMNGHLRMQAKISQTVTGAKSFFLKAIDPFFKKDGAGAVVPISISGTRDAPTIGVTVFHKTIKKNMGDQGKDNKDKNDKDKKDDKNKN